MKDKYYLSKKKNCVYNECVLKPKFHPFTDIVNNLPLYNTVGISQGLRHLLLEDIHLTDLLGLHLIKQTKW